MSGDEFSREGTYKLIKFIVFIFESVIIAGAQPVGRWYIIWYVMVLKTSELLSDIYVFH